MNCLCHHGRYSDFFIPTKRLPDTSNLFAKVMECSVVYRFTTRWVATACPLTKEVTRITPAGNPEVFSW